MDYVYKGAWNDPLQTKVRQWVTSKFVGWKEEDPGNEFAEYVQELIVTGKKSIAEIETAFEELALGEGRARELAIGLGDLLHKFERASSSVASSSSNPLLAPLKTGREANKALSANENRRNEEPVQMGALRTNREGRDNNNDHQRERDNRPARDTIAKHLQQSGQQRDIHSRLGKRVSEDEHGYDKRNRRDTSESQHDTIAYITRMNQVAQEAGFANAREMMAMLGPNALQPGPMLTPPHAPPVAPPLGYGAPSGPYMGQQGGGFAHQVGNDWSYGHGYHPPHMEPSIMMIPQGGYPPYQQQQYGYNYPYVPGGHGVGRGFIDGRGSDGRTGRGGGRGRNNGQPPAPPAEIKESVVAPKNDAPAATTDVSPVTKEDTTATVGATAPSTSIVNGRGVGGRGGRGRGRGDQSFSWVNPGLINGGTAPAANTNAAQQAPKAAVAAAVSRNPFAAGGGALQPSQSATASTFNNEATFVAGRGAGGRFSPAGRGGRGFAGRTNNVFAFAAAAGPGAMGNAPQHKVWVRPTDTESSLANTR